MLVINKTPQVGRRFADYMLELRIIAALFWRSSDTVVWIREKSKAGNIKKDLEEVYNINGLIIEPVKHGEASYGHEQYFVTDEWPSGLGNYNLGWRSVIKENKIIAYRLKIKK